MATVTWKGGSGNWTDHNWTGASTYPQTNDDVVLPATGSAYTVTASSSTSVTLDSLTLGAAAKLVLNGASITSNEVITVAGGTIQANASASLTAGSGIALSANAELDVNATATVTVSSQFTANASVIHLYGATMSVSNGIVLSNNASFIGYGELSGSNDSITGAGTVTASGGTLTLDGAIGNDGSNVTKLVIGAGTTLALNSTYGIGDGAGSLLNPTLTFTNASGATDTFQAVAIYQGQLFIGAISGFGQGDYIDVQKFGSGDTVSCSGSTVTISAAGGGSSQTYTFSSSAVASQVVAGSSTTGVSGGAINTVTVNGKLADQLSYCFMPGTLIRTPDGEALIETVRRGDLVLTAEGAAKPVVWVGRQTIVSRFADPVGNLPIRITAGALADNVPSRDLLVSPEHALLIEGILVHAGALVNGSSICRESQVPDSFVYYHIELEDHSLVLAENVPAETFVDNVDRRHFDNWEEHEALYPEGRPVAELPLPRAKALRQVPLSIRVALDERAMAMRDSAAA